MNPHDTERGRCICDTCMDASYARMEAECTRVDAEWRASADRLAVESDAAE